jgi:hypothetical protein
MRTVVEMCRKKRKDCVSLDCKAAKECDELYMVVATRWICRVCRGLVGGEEEREPALGYVL